MSSSEDLPIIPIGVKDAPFTLDLIARDCPPTQFVREFTINGIEAIQAYRDQIDPAYAGHRDDVAQLRQDLAAAHGEILALRRRLGEQHR